MKAIILTVLGLAVYCSASATPPAWSDLRGTFLILKDTSFAPFPRTIRESRFTDESWTRVSSTANDCTNGGLFKGIQYTRANDYSVGLLYNVNGVIAGIQMLIPQNVVKTSTNTLRYDLIPMYVEQTISGQKYYTLSAYFVDPSTICSNARSDADLETEGTGTGLWIQNGTQITQVPSYRPDATNSGWTQNNCFPGMGAHNFHKLEQYTQTGCTEMSPIFGLYNNMDRLHGFGFITVGNITNPRFEQPPPTAIKMILGDTPPCVLDVQKREGVTSIHVYFIPSPQTFLCDFGISKTIYSVFNETRNWLSRWG